MSPSTPSQAFVETWSQVWRGPDSDPHRYMELLHEGCRLVNPISSGTREDLPQIFQAFLAVEPDIRVMPTHWAETPDGSVLIEWVNKGTLRGAPFELHGVDRFTLRDGKAIEGYSYFDPRPFLEDADAVGA
jgi:SnoaL-like domain